MQARIPVNVVFSGSRHEEDSVPDPRHEHPDQSFLLGFVEFDDQGKPYDRDQITTLFDRIKMEAQYRDLCIIVFVHGWKHNAGISDSNVVQFRRLLQQVAQMELERPPGRYWPTRKVVGIYVGAMVWSRRVLRAAWSWLKQTT